MAHVIKANSTQQAGGAAALKLADFQAQAEAIVQEARRQAQRIIADAQAEADSIRKDAAPGSSADNPSGRQQAQTSPQRPEATVGSDDKLAAEIAETAAMARQLVAQLSAARWELVECAGREMVHLAIAIAEKIVGHVASSDPSAAQANLQKAIELCTGGKITARVNPSQLELLRRHCAELAETLAGAGVVELVADEQITAGGVKVLAGGGFVDATIETQWANIVEALLGQFRRDGQAGIYVPETGQPQDAGAQQGTATWLRTAIVSRNDAERQAGGQVI